MNKSFWVLECKEVDLYLGTKCGKTHYCVGIDDALKFDSRELAERVLELTELQGRKYKVTEHMFMDMPAEKDAVVINYKDSKDGVAMFMVDDSNGTFRLTASSNSIAAKIEVMDRLLNHLRDELDAVLDSKLNPDQFVLMNDLFDSVVQAEADISNALYNIEHAPADIDLNILHKPEVKNEQP